MFLWQGGKMVEEFFQEVDQLAFTAGYTNTHHDDVLIKLLHSAIRTHTIDCIYSQPVLPADYQMWKRQILNINGLQRCWVEQKKSQMQFSSAWPVFVKKPERRTNALVPQIKTGTGITYGGQGQYMDLDRAKSEGLCFWCVVLLQSSSQPWFKHELLRTWLMPSSKFRLQLEPNTRSGPRFPQVRILLNLFEQVQTPLNQWKISFQFCQFYGIVALESPQRALSHTPHGRNSKLLRPIQPLNAHHDLVMWPCDAWVLNRGRNSQS